MFVHLLGANVLAKVIPHRVCKRGAEFVFWPTAAIDAGRWGVVSYCRSFGEGVTLNRGDDSPGTDSGRQATSCEPMTVSTLG